MNFGADDAAWIWMAVAALLAITELAIPGLFLVWLAAAALLTGIATMALSLALPSQLILFAMMAVLTVLLGRRAYGRAAHVTSDPLLNDRVARLIGQTVTVAVAIEHGEGRVRVGDSVWAATGPDAAVGERVRISGADGASLRVAPVPEALPPPGAA